MIINLLKLLKGTREKGIVTGDNMASIEIEKTKVY